MRGYSIDPTVESMDLQSDQQPVPMTQAPIETGNNMQNNTQLATSPGSVYWLFLITIVYFAWGYWQDKSVKENAKYSNIKINLHNIVGVTLGVVIGFNIMNVFLTKLSAMRIPLISKTAGTFLPLFHL